MFKVLPFWTAGAAALLICLGLRFLQYFKFIHWHPAGWTRRIGIQDGPWYVDWGLLFAGIFLAGLVLYLLSMLLAKWPPAVTAAVIGLVIAAAVEWMVLRPGSLTGFKDRLSIPFFVLVLMATRFIMETAVFQKKQQHSSPK